MKPNQIKKLFEANMVQLNRLNVKAGSAVKAVLMAAEANGPVYVRLLNPSGDSIEYDVVEGNRDVLERVGNSLGVTITPTQIVVETKSKVQDEKSFTKKRVKLNAGLEESTE